MLTIGIYGIQDTTHYSGRPTYVHDHGLAVMRGGHVLTTVQLERHTGVKHDNDMPSNASELLKQIIKKYRFPDEKIRFVSVNSFMGNSFISKEGNLRIEPVCELNVEDVFVPAFCRFYPDGINSEKAEALIMCHEFAHIASILPFTGSFKPNSLLVHIDGGASDSTSSVWHFDGEEMRYLDHSWNELKTVANNFNTNPLALNILGHGPEEHLSLPGKLMGYSSLGDVDERIMEWLVSNNWFLDYYVDEKDLLKVINEEFNTSFKTFDKHSKLFMDIASCFQKYLQEKVIEFIMKWKTKTGADHLYYSGGVALNIVTNSVLESDCGFDGVFISPPASDSGLAIGAAAFLEYSDNGQVAKHSVFLERFDTDEYPEELSFDLNEIADYLNEGNIIGLCIGPGEIGPRALGHRSIIARADNIEIRKRVSEVIKGREWYRPVAPVVADVVAREVLNDYIPESFISKYMLNQYFIKEEFADAFKGAMHTDGTVRAQIISVDDVENRFLYELLLIMREKYGCMGLINTSFNVKGKPIVHSPEEALCIGREMGLDGVWIGKKFSKF